MIPQNQNEAEILSRLQHLERIVHKGKTYEENYGKTSESEQGEPQRPTQ